MTDKPLTIADYQRLAMRTANSNPAAATPEDKLLNAMLGAIGEGGEIAIYGLLSSEFSTGILNIAHFNGEIADAVKKHYYHGHSIDPEELKSNIREIRQATVYMLRALGSEGVGAPQARLWTDMPDVDTLVGELGDLLWYITLAADAIGVPLEEIAQRNVEKLRRRYPDGFSVEDSINRED